MDFYKLEEENLTNDQRDNELIRQLINNYQSLKEIIKTSQLEREDLHSQIQFLRGKTYPTQAKIKPYLTNYNSLNNSTNQQ